LHPLPSLGLAGILSMGLACTLAPATPPLGTAGTIIALLADGRLVFVAPNGTTSFHEIRADSAAIDQAAGHLLHQTADRRFLTATIPRADYSSTKLVLIDLATGSTASRRMPAGDAVYAASILGQHSRLIYLVGRQTDSVVISTFALPSLEQTTRRAGRAVRNPSKYIVAAHMSADESRLYITYHEWTDWFDVSDTMLTPCAVGAAAGGWCLASHGLVLPWKGILIHATGGPVLRMTTPDGIPIDSLRIDLEGNHLMEFALDSANERVVATGSCGYAGGFATVKLPPSPSKARVAGSLWPRSAPSPICGERVTLDATGQIAVIAKRALPVTASRGPGELLVVDVDTQKLLRRIPVPAPPIDVIILR
jgi:hypothetical protein